mgnify:CR=1 FL=1
MKNLEIIRKCSLLFRQKLKASSLIEINVGIVIIGIIFSLSMMIYVNITATSLQANQIKY